MISNWPNTWNIFKTIKRRVIGSPGALKPHEGFICKLSLTTNYPDKNVRPKTCPTKTLPTVSLVQLSSTVRKFFKIVHQHVLVCNIPAQFFATTTKATFSTRAHRADRSWSVNCTTKLHPWTSFFPFQKLLQRAAPSSSKVRTTETILHSPLPPSIPTKEENCSVKNFSKLPVRHH